MGLGHDLLLQADHLATYEAHPSQASLRRAVSAAYYALFHLLIEDGASRWQGSPEARTAVERGFDHGNMRKASELFRKPSFMDWQGNPQGIPPSLQTVAATFIDLQEKRQLADYDNSRQWVPSQVLDLIAGARDAFTAWESVRTDPMAGNYLLKMLLKPR